MAISLNGSAPTTFSHELNFPNVGRKNLLINGGFQVNQRGVTSAPSISSLTFLADRWYTYASASECSASIQTATLPNGKVVNTFKTTASSNIASGWLHPAQQIEALGLDYLKGQTVTFSAWVRTTLSGQFMRICDTQCDLIGSEIPNDGQWHYITAQRVIPSNQLTGANDAIQFQPAWGTTNVVAGDYIEFAEPQMELGSVATPFEHRSYGEELALCRRYFQKYSYGSSSTSYITIGGAYATGTNTSRGSFNLDTPMRSFPSAYTSGTFAVNPSASVTTLAFEIGSVSNARINFTTSSSIPEGNVAMLYNTSEASISFDAEL